MTVDPAAGVYSDPTTLRATVSPATYLDQTISGNVQFSIDGNPVGAPVPVDSSGVATTSYTIDVGAGPHTITAAFTSTNSAFLNSSNTGTLTLSREDATVTPSNSNPDAVQVNSPGGTAGPITLCFDMNEVSDGSPGNTTNITSVTVTVTPIGGGSPRFAGAGQLQRRRCWRNAYRLRNAYECSRKRLRRVVDDQWRLLTGLRPYGAYRLRSVARVCHRRRQPDSQRL